MAPGRGRAGAGPGRTRVEGTVTSARPKSDDSMSVIRVPASVDSVEDLPVNKQQSRAGAFDSHDDVLVGDGDVTSVPGPAAARAAAGPAALGGPGGG